MARLNGKPYRMKCKPYIWIMWITNQAHPIDKIAALTPKPFNAPGYKKHLFVINQCLN